MSAPRVPLSLKHKAVVAGGIGLLAVCAMSAVFGSSGVVDLRRLCDEQSAAEKEAYDLAQRNAQLREHLAKLDADDAYLEKVARERLGWVKPGERRYRVTAASR